MCTDTEQCEGPDNVVKTLATLHGPGMERALDRFIEHMRKIIPDFAKDVERDMLLVVFSAGRNDAIKYIRDHTEMLYDAAHAMTAMALSNYSDGRGLDVDTMNANLDRYNAEHAKEAAP